jgi:HAMP domain-containing protein
VYVRHTVAKGYKLAKAPEERERLGASYLFRVDVAPNGKSEVVIEEATPLFKTTDIRSAEGVAMVKVYLSSAAAEGPLKAAVTELIKVQNEIGNLEQHIGTMREQMQEYRARMDELHAQIVTLKAVKTNGTTLMQHLEKKLQEVSEKLSKATVDLVGVQEKLMVARIRFQDGVSELSLEKKPDAAEPSAPAKPATKI